MFYCDDLTGISPVRHRASPAILTISKEKAATREGKVVE